MSDYNFIWILKEEVSVVHDIRENYLNLSFFKEHCTSVRRKGSASVNALLLSEEDFLIFI